MNIKNKKEDNTMKKTNILMDLAYGFAFAAILYVIISFIQVNTCNLNGGEIAAWNFFQLLVR